MILTFKEKFIPLIRAGKKTQTIRLWKTCFLQPGSVVNCPKLGKVRINSIDRIFLSQLTERDAAPEGFQTLDELLQTVRKIYSLKRTANVPCFRIRFAYLGKKETLKTPAARKTAANRTRRVNPPSKAQLRLISPF